MRPLWLVAPLTAVVLVVAACNSGDEPATTIPPTTATVTSLPPIATTTAAPATTTTTTPPTTTTQPAVTTTTIALVTSPLNGLGYPVDPGLAARRVQAVKIDNAPKGRPQAGLETAEAVYELPVEGGFTRFIALFHLTDLEYVGPIRSIRPTDSSLIVPLGAPLQISGGQKYVIDLIRNDGGRILFSQKGVTFRIPERRAPLNLFGNTTAMRAHADGRGYPDEPPPPIATFGEPTPTDTRASRIIMDFSSRPAVSWLWNGNQYLRFNGDTPHNWFNDQGETRHVAFDTVLVLQADPYTAQPPLVVKEGKDKPVPDGSPVPAFKTVGSNDAFLFYDGHVVEGTWQRKRLEDTFELTTEDGSPMILPPGRLWITIMPTNREFTWR